MMPQAVVPSPFGVLIPGAEIQYSFEQVGDKGVLTIPNPKSINVIGFFLNQPLANNEIGASLYFSVPPYENLEFVGAIGNERPSDVFHTGWALNPLVNIQSEIKLVVQLDPLSSIGQCIKIKQETDLNQVFAKKVAYNLFNYLKSFNANENAGCDGMLVVPLNSIDKWFDKFIRKYQADPNFVFRTDNE